MKVHLIVSLNPSGTPGKTAVLNESSRGISPWRMHHVVAELTSDNGC